MFVKILIVSMLTVQTMSMVIRDRPFERTLTLHKDSTGHIGFQFKEGKITAIAVDSSAARNGLLIDHNLLEVNGQNVVGIKDKEIGSIIEQGGNVITVAVAAQHGSPAAAVAGIAAAADAAPAPGGQGCLEEAIPIYDDTSLLRLNVGF